MKFRCPDVEIRTTFVEYFSLVARIDFASILPDFWLLDQTKSPIFRVSIFLCPDGVPISVPRAQQSAPRPKIPVPTPAVFIPPPAVVSHSSTAPLSWRLSRTLSRDAFADKRSRTFSPHDAANESP